MGRPGFPTMALGALALALALALAVAVAVAIGIVQESRRKRQVRKLLTRGNWEHLWRERFPMVPCAEVARFLALFAEAFSLPWLREFSLSPDDRVMDIYRAIYPGPAAGDRFEWESLGLELSEQYGLELSSMPAREVTLGSIFGAITAHRPR